VHDPSPDPEPAISTRTQWLVPILAVVVLAVTGSAIWYYSSYQPTARQTHAANAALDRIHLPNGWAQVEATGVRDDTGNMVWSRLYEIPHADYRDVLVAFADRVKAAGATLAVNSQCNHSLSGCLDLYYPPNYTIYVSANRNFVEHYCPWGDCAELSIFMRPRRT
jgi:hypothetical protein